jgi:hypothetical protein
MTLAATSYRWFRNSDKNSEDIGDNYLLGIPESNKPSLTADPLKDHYLISGF